MNDMIELGTVEVQAPEERSERRDAAENRQLILQTATLLFDENGVQAVNMAEIAKAAGVGKGTLYRRFSNKGELCLSLLDEALRTFQNQMLEELREMTQQETTYLDQLKTLFERTVHFIYSELDLMIEIDQITVNGLVQDVNTPHFWLDMTIRGLIQAGIQAGELRPDLDVAYLISALLAPLDARILRAHTRDRGFSLDEITAGLAQLLDGLRRP